MVEKRDNLLIIAVGRKKVGKTYQAILSIDNYVKSNSKKKGGKVLIFDVNMEYTQYKTIALQDVKRLALSDKPEVRRLLPRKPDGTIMGIDEMVSTLEVILKDYRNGLLVLDDINKYMISTASVAVVSSICTLRHQGVDLLINMQSLSAITPRLFQNTEFIRFHYIMDDVERIKDRLPDFPLYKLAQIIVNNKYNSGDKRFFCYIDCSEQVINGSFTKKDFEKACMDFIMVTPRLLKAEQLRTKNKDLALKNLIKELTIKYYGNPK